jgi:hypothetical protein
LLLSAGSGIRLHIPFLPSRKQRNLNARLPLILLDANPVVPVVDLPDPTVAEHIALVPIHWFIVNLNLLLYQHSPLLFLIAKAMLPLYPILEDQIEAGHVRSPILAL